MRTARACRTVTVNGKSAYAYYISPTQLNILTPPDALLSSVQVQVANGGVVSAAYTAQAQAASPSFFVFNGGPYVAAEHLKGSLLGPASLYPGSTTPAAPGETVVLYANGFGDQCARGRRIGIAVGNPVAAACDRDWRRRGNGAVRRPGRAGRVSVQRGGAGIAGQWRSADHGNL